LYRGSRRADHVFGVTLSPLPSFGRMPESSAVALAVLCILHYFAGDSLLLYALLAHRLA
jgi:hypothetical protein